MTAQEIGAKLAPLGCAAKPASPSNINFGDIKPVNSLECTINNEDTSIDEYLNAQQVAYEVKLAETAGCSLLKQFGISDSYYVQGYNWTVTPKTASTTQAIQKAIGAGKVQHLHCS
jgi:hypothetical protein